MNSSYYKRPEILSRPELEKGHAVIEASAGTGKTFTLEHLVLDLIINKKAKIEEILVVTFTDAATRELRERVRALIRKVCDESGELKPGENSEDCWEIDDAVRGRLREALFRFDGASISTIHGFCQRVLSEQAFLGGRLFEQEHVDGAEIFGLAFREEIRIALAEDSPVGDALRLWIERENRLQALEELLYRCHREGCPDRCPITPLWDPQGLLEVAEGLPSQEDLNSAIQELFTDNLSRGGFEKLLQRLFAALAGIESAETPQDAVLTFMDWADKKCSINKVDNKQIDHLNRAAGITGAPGTLKDLVTGLDEIVKRAAPEGSFFAYELLPRVQMRLSSRKRSLGLIDYDDMLLGVREALTGRDSGVLIDTLRQRWTYALVDEFQDTDPVQWEIFRKIFVDGTRNHRLFVIGDPKQAIYSFRGADVHTYEQAKNHLIDKCAAARLPLTYNFRSTESLIEAVNDILMIEDAQGKVFFDGLNRYEEPVQCGDKTRRAEVSGQPVAPVHLLHLHGGDEKLTAQSVKRGIGCFIAEEILHLTSPEHGLITSGRDRKPAPIELSDIYVLTRTGREGREIGDILRRYGIPHAFYKQEGLFQTTEADDIHRLLCAIDTPEEPAARMSAWLTPFFGVALSDLPAWKEVGGSHPLVALLLEWKRLADAHAFSRLFDTIVTGSGLVRRLIFSGEERALTNYLHLFELLLAEAHSHPVTLTELARGLKARIDGRKMPEGREGDVQRLETDKDAVQILTMHKAKGLEAEVVFIGGGFGNPGGRGIKMSIYHRDYMRCLHIGRAMGEIAEAIEQETGEENQRLMYVAMTRAKSILYLPYFGKAPAQTDQADSYGYKNLGSFYRKIQKQLELLHNDGRFNERNRFDLRDLSCQLRPPRGHREEIELAGWPEEGLLEPPESSTKKAEEIKPGHRGVLLTSYTRMSRGKSWQAPSADEDDRMARRDEEVAAEVQLEEIPGRKNERAHAEQDDLLELPGGRETGTFLHTLLENTPADEITECSFRQWSTLPAVQQRAAATARQHGFSEDYLPAALELVYNALRTPVSVQSREMNSILQMAGGFASGKRHSTEMAFIYPIPEAFHPLINRDTADAVSFDRLPYETVRGYLQGLIDLVFEHEGKVYLLDWKSDRLPEFGEANLNSHVEANYRLQAQVYALAVIRLLGIMSGDEYEANFGGILYAFMRGIRLEDGEQDGIWFSRPPWNLVASWEKDFVNRSEWGGEVIEPSETWQAAGCERGDCDD
ncbi:MAG: UvrD-helicase domain-containing protein [Bacillota bacterium]